MSCSQSPGEAGTHSPVASKNEVRRQLSSGGSSGAAAAQVGRWQDRDPILLRDCYRRSPATLEDHAGSTPPQKPQRLVKAPKQRQKAAARKEEPQPAAKTGPPQPQSILEVAKLRLSLPNESEGSVRVRFNHYNKSFPLHNSVLRWSDVDEEYCFSFVYRGDFKRYLTLVPNKVRFNNKFFHY
ncbi:hypothetical protein B484DRAFT_402805 [Ochromonadaceae sp. CCMP2298]|nr:hypothetical protein B484DRAFT_402805 [Ochromonadaceae sp. CCMP2298]